MAIKTYINSQEIICLLVDNQATLTRRNIKTWYVVGLQEQIVLADLLLEYTFVLEF